MADGRQIDMAKFISDAEMEALESKPQRVGGTKKFISDDEMMQMEAGQTQAKPKRGFLQDLAYGTVEALPLAGGLAGGVFGSALGPIGTVGGGALGTGAGKAAENFLKQLIYDEDISMAKGFTDPIKEAGYDVAGLGAGKVIGGAGGLLKKPVAGFLSRFEQPLKEGAEEVMAAGKRLGATPTRGMLTENQVIGGLESALAQKPSDIGKRYAGQFRDVGEAMRGGAEDILKAGKESTKTGLQTAEDVRGSLIKSIEGKAEKATPFFDSLKKDAAFIDINEKGRSAISKNIRKLDYAKIQGSPEAAFANNIANNLEGTKNLAELRNLRSYVGKMLSDPMVPGTMKSTAGSIYGKLAELEKRSITRAAIESASSTRAGKNVAKNMLTELRTANKAYSEFSNELKDLAQKSGLGKINNYAEFVTKLQGLSGEQLSKKLFQPGNVKQLETFKKQFPEAFEDLKKAHLQDLYNKSLTKGEISIPKLINQADRMSPEARSLIFGKESAQKIKDIKTMYNNLPPKIGPSGTPQGEAYLRFNALSLVDPRTWFSELGDLATDYMLKNPTKTFRKLAPVFSEEEALLRSGTKARGLLKEPIIDPIRGLLGDE